MAEPTEHAAGLHAGGGGDLSSRLSTVAESLDGVDRLQPTLRHAVADLAARIVGGANDDLADLVRPGSPGIDVKEVVDGRVDVVVDISSWSDRSALATCRALRAAVEAEVRAADRQPGTITITVLDITQT